MASILIILIMGAVALSVLGAGVAVLVYFLTRQKNGSAKDLDKPRSQQQPPRQMPDNPASPDRGL